MAAEILRAALDNDICAEIERLLEMRREKCVVCDKQSLVLVGDIRKRTDVRDEHHRVGGRLDEDDLRLTAHLRTDERRVAHIDIVEGDAVTAVYIICEAYGTAVEILGQECVVARTAEGKDKIDRGHSRGERPCAPPALEERNCLLESTARRIRDAAVVIAGALTECGMAERRRQIDGAAERPRRIVAVTAVYLCREIFHNISSPDALLLSYG